MKSIETATINQFEENIDGLLEFMQETYTKIIDEGETFPHFVRHLFNTLLMERSVCQDNAMLEGLVGHWRRTHFQGTHLCREFED